MMRLLDVDFSCVLLSDTDVYVLPSRLLFEQSVVGDCNFRFMARGAPVPRCDCMDIKRPSIDVISLAADRLWCLRSAVNWRSHTLNTFEQRDAFDAGKHTACIANVQELDRLRL